MEIHLSREARAYYFLFLTYKMLLTQDGMGYVERRQINYPISWQRYRIYSWADLMGTDSLV